MNVGEYSGRVPASLRPSVGVAFMTDPGRELLLRHCESFGRVQFTASWALGHSSGLAHFRQILHGSMAKEVKPFADRGADVVLLVAGMPRWLSLTPEATAQFPTSGFHHWQAAPPRERGEYAWLVRDICKTSTDLFGQQVTVTGPANEPELFEFYSGSFDEYLADWDTFSVAARSFDRSMRIGGSNAAGILSRKQRDPHPEALTIRWLEHCNARRLWPDRIDFHHYFHGLNQPDIHAAVHAVRAKLSEIAPPIEFSCGEWALSLTPDTRKDTHEGAAFVICTVLEFERGGQVGGHTWNTAQDFGAGAFVGGLGLITREPAMPKASLFAMKMLGMLYPTRAPVTLTPAETSAKVYAIATRSAAPIEGRHRLRIIVSRFDARPGAEPITVPLDLGSPIGPWQIFAIDAERTNPLERYRDELRRSADPVAAAEAARATELELYGAGEGGESHSLSVPPMSTFLIDATERTAP